MDFLAKEFVDHYHKERPHQSLGNLRLMTNENSPTLGGGCAAQVACRQRLGGLLKHYYYKAA